MDKARMTATRHFDMVSLQMSMISTGSFRATFAPPLAVRSHCVFGGGKEYWKKLTSVGLQDVVVRDVLGPPAEE